MEARLFILLPLLLTSAATRSSSHVPLHDVRLPTETRTTWKLASKLEYRLCDFSKHNSYKCILNIFIGIDHESLLSFISINCFNFMSFYFCQWLRLLRHRLINSKSKCVSRISGLSLCPFVPLRRYIPDSNPAPGSAVTPQDTTDAATLNDLTRPVSTARSNKDSRPDSTPSPDDTKPHIAHQSDKICLRPVSSRQGVNTATSTGWLR